ncbi:tyrosine-type recombinase/integrase [Collimonas antrihumi]|uniref:tyrosine-type recombinase/integrase n=1 Tax=Collimonas antrihumi TaxID=1940615 RepID=UPI001FE9279A|nr:integrase arm-type DNA-binding domain-containing protein [Collimonas antrihumi]
MKTGICKMPKLAKPLTDIQPRNAKGGVKPKGFGGRKEDEPTDKPYTLPDGGGLYLLVNPDGSKYWRMQCRFAGAPRLLAFGKYPDVSLATARELRQQTKAQIRAGIDPAQAKRIDKINKATANANTFEAVAREWHANKVDTWQPRTAANVLHRLEKDVFPLIGKQPIADIRAPVMLDVLRQIEKRGAVDMAKRQGQVCGQIFRYAIASGKAEIDPVPSLRGALKETSKGHHAAITPDELPEFLRAFEKIEGRMYAPTRIMFRLMMLTFVRTSELTTTAWSEIDIENEDWVIPWQRMKMGKKRLNPRKVDHHVFLPSQGWELLRELKEHTGNNKYLFPNLRDPSQPATNYGILAAVKRMGYSGKMTGHGFRSLAMGVIKERLGYRHEVVDRQLSHASGDTYGEAYDRALFLDERKVMMQQYADYLYSAASGKVIAGKFGKAA